MCSPSETAQFIAEKIAGNVKSSNKACLIMVCCVSQTLFHKVFGRERFLAVDIVQWVVLDQ